MIRKLLALAFRNTYVLIWLITAALAVCLWMFGPFIVWGEWDPFGDPLDRMVWIGGLAGFALFLCLLVWFVRWRRERRMNADLVASTEGEEDDGVATEAEEMRQKLRAALALLRKSKMGSKSLYELPWYVMIGPPGAGKTTAIVNSGLKFPLVEEFGQGAIDGVGGTRNCDWWFTDHAVMIDTAGRYTTQESDAEADNQGWLNFLALLKKHRKRQPINGAIIAISLSDLSMQDEATQAGHARAIRRRLHELREKLGVRFPVYVVFTKADLIAGFTEFFDNLGKEAREQVWGFTLPLETSRGAVSPVAAFDEEFSGLLTQLNAQSLERLQQETDHQKRSLIAGFPGQVASIRQVARDFLSEVFQDNKFSERHMLRGVYLASGTQEGTPIDRLMMGMARTFGIGRQAIGSGRGTGRSFFLTRLFEGVIFREAGLVSADDRVERRYRIARSAAIAATLVAAVAAGSVWLRSFLGNQTLIAEAEVRMAEFAAEGAVIRPSPVGDTDVASTVPALNKLRALPRNPLADDVAPAGALGYGLYQGRILGASAAQAYRGALNRHLLPRLLLRLEQQMQGAMSNPDYLYEVLKVYLMLGQRGPMNAELVREFLVADWNTAFIGVGSDELKANLAQHLDALLSQPMLAIELNGPLVEQAQDILSRMPMSQRIYSGIINSPRSLELPKWRLTDVGGPALDKVLVRSSGKPLDEPIEGIFTYQGFNTVFLLEALGVARRLQSEAWVLGDKNVAVQSEVAMLAVARDVLDLYYADYIARYEGLLSDVDIVPMTSMQQAVAVANELSLPTSPLMNMLTAVAQETRLTEDRSVVPGAAVGVGISAAAGLELRSMLSAQATVFVNALEAANPGGPKPLPPGVFVEERFAWLHELVERVDDEPSQLDELRVVLEAVYREMSRLSITAGSGGGIVAPDEASALIELIQIGQRLPGPMQRWIAQVAAGSSGVSAEGTRATINAKWQSQVLPVCEQTLAGRYPFNRRAAAEVGIADFTRMFGPGNLLDGFFTENLAQIVDTRTRPWTFKQVNGADLGMAPAALEAFQQAAEIRAAFFPQGPQPAVRFGLTPTAVDPNATSVTLEVDGVSAKLSQGEGQPPPTGVVWPGPAGFGRITFDPPLPGAENSLRKDGPWGWFRLLDAAEIRNTDVEGRRRVIFKVGGRLAIFLLQTDSALNPFALPSLYKFTCPKSF
jgi:type VI secretion system protein ImpL